MDPLKEVERWAKAWTVEPPNPLDSSAWFCDHRMIRVPSSTAARDNRVRRMCVQPGCGLVDFVSPDSDLLKWGPNYGRDY